MLVISCSGAKHVAKNIAKKAKADFSELFIKKFPDNELDIRFKKDIRNKKVVLVQSFYGNLNEKIVETLLALYTAKDLKAKKVTLLALYFPYIRQDKRFKKGECVSARVMSKLFSVADKILVIEPHLHRIKKIRDLFRKGKKISVISDIDNYLESSEIKKPVFIGPDIESSQWAKSAAKKLNSECYVLRKERLGSRKVRIRPPKNAELKNRNIVIIDDIISTGHTMLETIKELKKFKPKEIYCIAVHGIFAENALEKLRKHSKVISCNTIPSRAAKIDVSESAAEAVKNE